MIRILLSSTVNTRDIGGFIVNGGEKTNNNSFLRSDLPKSLNDTDIQFLVGKGITTIVDLRSDEEVNTRPCALKESKDFIYHHCKVYGDGRLPESVHFVPTSYFEMVAEEKSIYNIMKVLANAEGGILYHCTAGKDRTGVVTALLLSLVGVSISDILVDYNTTEQYLRPFLEQYCEENKHVDINIITPKKEYMKSFLGMFHEKYNSVEDYLLKIGLDNEEIAKLRRKLVNCI